MIVKRLIVEKRNDFQYSSHSKIQIFPSTRTEKGGSEVLSYKTELQNQVTQNDVTLRVTNSKVFIEIFF